MTRSVTRALAILDAFEPQRTTLGLQEIAARLSLPKATTFRLVNTLEASGFLVRLENQQYCLGLKIIRLAGLVQSTMSVRELARPIMISVREQSGETVTLNQRVGAERIVLEVMEAPQPLMTIVRQGEHVPLLMGATGRILLATMPPEERDAVLETAGQEISRPALLRDLERFRRQGFAVTRNQRVAGVTAVAVPVRSMDGAFLHSLAVTGPSIRMDAKEDDLIALLLAAGEELSVRLGSRVSGEREAAAPRPKAGKQAATKRGGA